ncbi:carbonic anhydrase [Myceligenerans pegani]|uniref:carbonic anhydrase n=1 Tax=Myceligenerans pegani TaxID=2776917 RepID=A0ABR9N479_9MICO|nr:carbonic anhydrase family protein [Myceligenerans sp. TRM 65318]MBE1877914.1 carbonic anhydrase family protein [Myceligenerans sp. TRM 65318]MBE3020185.1 carbonic anhydrase family protein [Myceligenerans sp. TRM 65318]
MSVRTRTIVPAVLLFAVTGLTACAADPAPAPPAQEAEEAAPDAEEVHWSYDGEEGPAHWGELTDDFALCVDGSHQSPVDLPAEVPDSDHETHLEVEDTEGVVADTGHTFQLTVADGGTGLTYDGENYDLVQMHYHVPSEHTVEGDAADVEFHFVHQSADGGVLVLGLMGEEGEETPAMQPFIDAVNAEHDTDTDEEADTDDEGTETGLDLSTILPDDSSAYSYEGSLTTPPCTEGVHWLVLEERISLSPEQLEVLTGAEDHNARPTQPLGDREIDGTEVTSDDE